MSKKIHQSKDDKVSKTEDNSIEKSDNELNKEKDLILKAVGSDLYCYAMTTAAYSIFFIIWINIALAIDSVEKTSLTKDIMSIGAADPLRILIAMYAITIGTWIIFGGRTDKFHDILIKKNSEISLGKLQKSWISINRILLFSAKFSKDTTFIFLGLLIATGVVLSFRSTANISHLAAHLGVGVTFFFIYGFLDFISRSFIFHKNRNYLIDLAIGMFLISLFLPILLIKDFS